MQKNFNFLNCSEYEQVKLFNRNKEYKKKLNIYNQEGLIGPKQ